MKGQRTPGPWRVGLRDDGEPIIEFAGGGWMSIDFPFGSKLRANRVANADLIAAAPELLEACREAHRYFINRPGNHETQVCEFLGKAIAKAEGKQ